MCVAAIAWNAHPNWRLVAIGNRDEFHTRLAAPLHWWDNGIAAGRDLEAGGTWLGVKQGRFALVTNRRAEDYPRSGMVSRGNLVTDWLLGKDRSETERMNPFNLIVADPRGLRLMTNYPEQIALTLPNGIHTLSNGGLDEAWFKERQLAKALDHWIAADAPPEALLVALADRQADPEQDDAPLSPVFIAQPAYGTRCSTVIAIGTDGKGWMIERSFDASARVTGTVSLALD